MLSSLLGRVTGTDSCESIDVSPDALFDALQNSRRRRAIQILADRPSGKIQLGELADEITAREQAPSSDPFTASERKSVYVSLYQSHLDTLASAGIIRWDGDSGKIETTEATAKIARLIQRVETKTCKNPNDGQEELVGGGINE